MPEKLQEEFFMYVFVVEFVSSSNVIHIVCLTL